MTWIRQSPAATLLTAQLTAVLLYPFVADSAFGHAVLAVIGAIVVSLAILVAYASPALTWVAISLGVPSVACSVWEALAPASHFAHIATAAFHIPLYFYISFALIRGLIADDQISRDDLISTGATFTVVAWGFAYLFQLIQELWPGSWAGGTLTGARSWFDLLFLSFSTLTGVGLSDILPATPQARSAIMLAAFSGVMYLALVVGRAVGHTMATRSRS